MAKPRDEWWKEYEIRTGGDGKVGIYTREYNCRLATFNANTHALQTRLKLLFERASKPTKPKKPRRRAGQLRPGDLDAMGFSDKSFRSLRLVRRP